MKIVKLIFWSLVIAFVAIVVVQNRMVFSESKSVGINLMVWEYESPRIFLGVYFLSFFLIGLLVSYFSALTERFKSKNEMKTYQARVSKLEEEVKALKSLPLQEEKPPSQPAENV